MDGTMEVMTSFLPIQNLNMAGPPPK